MIDISSQQITSDVIKLVEDISGLTNISTSNTIDSLNIDSLELMTLAMDIEDKFHISLKDAAFRYETTVGQMIDEVINVIVASYTQK